MNKLELIAAMAEESGLSKADAERALDAFQNVVIGELEAGGEVKLVGFLKFEVRQRAARMGRNPQTGEPKPIPAKRAAVCKITYKISQPEPKKASKKRK